MTPTEAGGVMDGGEVGASSVPNLKQHLLSYVWVPADWMDVGGGSGYSRGSHYFYLSTGLAK